MLAARYMLLVFGVQLQVEGLENIANLPEDKKFIGKNLFVDFLKSFWFEVDLCGRRFDWFLPLVQPLPHQFSRLLRANRKPPLISSLQNLERDTQKQLQNPRFPHTHANVPTHTDIIKTLTAKYWM